MTPRLLVSDWATCNSFGELYVVVFLVLHVVLKSNIQYDPVKRLLHSFVACPRDQLPEQLMLSFFFNFTRFTIIYSY
jgi:hypothetical protein